MDATEVSCEVNQVLVLTGQKYKPCHTVASSGCMGQLVSQEVRVLHDSAMNWSERTPLVL